MKYSRSRRVADSTQKWTHRTEIVLIPAILACLTVLIRAQSNLTGLPCLSNPCIHGICLNNDNNTFLCYCIDGYTGHLCQTNWDECWSDPCLNGGICTDGIAQYNCTCPQGYQGDLCEENVNECESNPCRNNGTCIDGSNGYSCVCLSGYRGELCEIDVSVCNDTRETRCLNGGLCIEGPGIAFNCACPPGWFGRLCEEAIDECASFPCQNGAVCLDLNAGYACACPFGFAGRNCEVELEMCGDSSPCQNGALCLVEDWLRICYCVPDFHGDRCQFRYNECLLGPGCRNGGTCIDGVDGYDCSCPPGWSGNFCECHVISEDEMNCDYLFPTMIEGTTLPPKKQQTVPTGKEIQVPKTNHRKPSSTSSTPQTTSGHETSKKFLTFFPTECFPIWPRFTEEPSESATDTSVPVSKQGPRSWVTEPVYVSPETSSTRTTKVLTIEKSIIATWMQKSSKTTVKSTTPIKPTEMTVLRTTTETIQTASITRMTPATTITTTQSTTTAQTTPTTTTTQTTATTTRTTPTTTTAQTTPATTTMQTTATTTRTTPATTTAQTTLATTTTQTTEITTTELIPSRTVTNTILTTPPETIPPETTTETTTTIEFETAPTTTTETTETTAQTMPAIRTTQTTQSTTSTSYTATKKTEPTVETTSTHHLTKTTPAVPGPTISVTATKTTGKNDTVRTTCVTVRQETTTTTEVYTTAQGKISRPNATETTGTINDSVTTATSAPSPKPFDCTAIPCLNGGTCLNTTNGPKCLCETNWEGPFCGGRNEIRVAGFSKNSYVIHKLTNSRSIDIEVTAKTVAPEGLILYSHLGPNVFLILYLENGLLKFKFSCGLQTMVLSETQYIINNGFDFVASVTLDFTPATEIPLHCSATVRINNTLAMSGEQTTESMQTHSSFAWVYVGGVPNRYVDSEGVSKGFSGCMKNLTIDRERKDILQDSFDSVGITECKSLACLSNPCRSGSTCVEHNNTWTCLCPTGFLGRHCEISVCDNNLCQFGGTCAPFPGTGFVCLCPLGKQGLFCEKSINVTCPLFASSTGGLSSFAAYTVPTTEIYRDFQLTFKFVPHDMEQISLMLFVGQDGYHGTKSDHLSVSFIKGYVVLTWNLGSGPRRIFTRNPVAGRIFHTVRMGRIGQRAWLAVDNQKNVTGRSPGKLTELNAKNVIYLGGHHSKNFSSLPHDLPLHAGFSGCLFDVELRTGQMLMKIEKSTPAFSRGMGQCGAALCNENSCENGGGCINHGATYACLCADGWFGPTCSLRYNPCDSTRHNCSQGSTCVPLPKGFSCDCPVGKTGEFCEINEELSDVKFKGIRSYAAMSVDGLYQYQSCVDLEIKPANNNGLLLFSRRYEGNTFWSLSLQEGMVELRVSPGSRRRQGDVLVIKNRKSLALGKWHKIRAGRYGRRLFLWVEGTVTTGVLLPGETLPPTGTILYIGGFPDLSKTPLGIAGYTLKPFEGCIRKFGSQWKRIPLTKSNILQGRNVEDCDGTVCGGDVCQNGGTCHVDIKNNPHCVCLPQFIGKRCEYRLSCKQINCQNGGRCASEEGRNGQCQCPNGWVGPFCESALSVKAPKFGGNSYLLIDRTDSANAKKRETGNEFRFDFIHVNFTTAEPNGLLLWTSSDSDSEFVGIGMENEKLKLVWGWEGHETIVVEPGGRISDGNWHDLAVGFESPKIIIRMDGNVIYGSDDNYPGHPPATNGKFFFGGFPESAKVANRTLGHFRTGFNGCLNRIAWEIQSPIVDFSNFEGENIRTCDPFEM